MSLDSGREKGLNALARGVMISLDSCRHIAEWLIEETGVSETVIAAEFDPLDNDDHALNLAERPTFQDVAGRLAREEPVSFTDKCSFVATILAHDRAVEPRTKIVPHPLTPPEQDYLAGRLRLHTPCRLPRFAVRRPQGARARRRRALAGTSGSARSPGRSSSDDGPLPPEPPLGGLLRALSRLLRGRR